MAKFAGKIGFENSAEISPGIWNESIEERFYYGDLLRGHMQLENSGDVNDNVRLSNEISIVCDEYAYHNFASIRYVCYMGVKWKVTGVEVKHPRLILTIGGVYNA